MNIPEHYRQHYVLYVDDELQALKYFQRSLERDFSILIASSVSQAEELFQVHRDRIGVLITDQRMPHASGLQLLEQVRLKFPGVVRILVTAYSDIQTAVDAVNRGGAFRYITKPWNLEELKGTLLRAMDFFLLQRDRDQLIREKLHVVQAMALLDRVKSLLVLGACLSHHWNNTYSAIRAFLLQAPQGCARPKNDGTRPETVTEDFQDLLRAETWREALLAESTCAALPLRESRSPQNRQPPLTDVALRAEVLAQEWAPQILQHQVRVHSGASPCRLAVETTVVDTLLQAVLRNLSSVSPVNAAFTLELSLKPEPRPIVWLKARVTNSPPWTRDQLSRLFAGTSSLPASDQSPPALLLVFLLAYHCHGTVQVHATSAEGPGIDIELSNPTDTSQDALDARWVAQLYDELEARNSP